MHMYNQSPLWRTIFDLLSDEAQGSQNEIERITWRLYHAIKGKRR